MTTGAWLGLIPITIGAAITAVAAWLAVRQRRLERAGRQAVGRVVDIVVQRRVDKRGSTLEHFPVFEFVAEDGRTIRRQSAFGSGTPTHRVGDKIDISYDPADPERSDIRGEGQVYFIALAGVGLMFVAGGIVVILAALFR